MRAAARRGRRRTPPAPRPRRSSAEDEAASAALARHGADLLEAGAAGRVLTHCNTGALAAGGRGTALGVIAELADRRRACACSPARRARCCRARG